MSEPHTPLAPPPPPPMGKDPLLTIGGELSMSNEGGLTARRVSIDLMQLYTLCSVGACLDVLTMTRAEGV